MRLPKVNKTEDEYLKQLNFNFEQNVKEIGEALFGYLKWFEIGPSENDASALPKIEWDAEKRIKSQAIYHKTRRLAGIP